MEGKPCNFTLTRMNHFQVFVFRLKLGRINFVPDKEV